MISVKCCPPLQQPLFLALGVAAFLFSTSSHAASCCGGGSSSSLILPKFAEAMVDISLDHEQYDGFWDSQGDWVADPPGADLNQYRLNLGYAMRLGSRWQASISVPYAWNQNRYASFSRNTAGLGDSKVSVWYETFDDPSCVWEIKRWQDLVPAIYWGATLTLPTGISRYGDVQDNYDVTGQGLYRLDANVLLDKTVYPWNTTLSMSYGRYLERSVNRVDGNYVEPFDRQLGDRFNGSLSFGYTYFTDTMQSYTATLAYAYLEENKTRDDGEIDANTGLRKQSLSATIAWANDDRDWVTKLSWNHALDSDGMGRNFPTTDILTIGVSHVLR